MQTYKGNVPFKYLKTDFPSPDYISSHYGKGRCGWVGIQEINVKRPQDNTAPTITTITPNKGTANTTVSIYGTNLANATQISFYNSNNQLVSGHTNISVSSGGSPIQFVLSNLFVANTAPGTYQVRVVTPSGTSNAFPFTVTAQELGLNRARTQVASASSALGLGVGDTTMRLDSISSALKKLMEDIKRLLK